MTGPMGVGSNVNYNYAPIMAKNDKPAQEEKEIIQGGNYVTKTLKIDVDIDCLYLEDGTLTDEGKQLQKYIGFKRIDDNEFSFYGTEMKSLRTPRTIRYTPEAVKSFEYTFNKNDVKKIVFEEESLASADLISCKTTIKVKFLGANKRLLQDVTVYTTIMTYLHPR